MHGEGKLMLSNGDYYHGGFKSNLRHGYGEAKDEHGFYRLVLHLLFTYFFWPCCFQMAIFFAVISRGMFCDGLREGEGMFLYDNSASYVGGWRRNVPHGEGKFKNTDGFVIAGDFQDGVPSVWPAKIQIQNKSPIKVHRGEHITVDIQYVDQNDQPIQCYQGMPPYIIPMNLNIKLIIRKHR